MREHLVIAGGGQAATQAAQSARQVGFDGVISLISAEPWLPYQRPPLSKGFLAGELSRDHLSLKPEQFFRTREIGLRLGTRVDSLDPARMRVELSDGDTLHYSHLLLATGSEPRRLRVPGAELEGIHYLRSIDDVESIQRDLATGARILIVGAGYIGLEAAAVAVRLGLQVTILEAESQAMKRSVCPEVAAFFVDRHRQAGVEFHFQSAIARFTGDSRVSAAETANGDRVECDLAVVAIGVLPRLELAEAAGLVTGNGISTDVSCRTSVPSILAAGDCTSYPHPWVGKAIRFESVQNAIEQGKAAGAAIAGRDAAFDAIPWFWSDQYELKLQIAGLSAGFDETVIRGDPDTGSFSAYYLAAGRVIAVDSINDPHSFVAARKSLRDKPSWPRAAIADPDCDLSEL